MRFEVFYREAPNERPITYELAIALDDTGRPFVESEVLKQRAQRDRSTGAPIRSCVCTMVKAWSGRARKPWRSKMRQGRAQEEVELTELRQLGIATLGHLDESTRASSASEIS